MGKTKSLKSAKSTKRAKSCKFEKNSKDFNRVIEEYDAYKDIRLKFPGVPSLLDPVVTTDIAFEADYVSICLEDAVVECSRRCERDGKCTLFEVGDLDRYASRKYQYHCYMINNKMNEFNPRRIYSDLSRTGLHVYSNKSAPPLIEDVMPKGLYPANQTSDDFQTYGIPGVSCVGTQGFTNPTFNQALFDECSNCVLPYTVAYSGCTNLVTGVCGSLSPVSGNDLKSSEKFVYVPNFFSDDLCGQVCFAGEASNYACLSTLQTYVLAIQGQALIDHPLYGDSFGCTMSNIFDPTTGEQLPDYTCPPNTNQPTPK